jgi:hypothetical protein
MDATNCIVERVTSGAITGTIPYTVVEIHETVGSRPANIVNHKARWEIK